jgi:hypothetical protein
MLEPLVRKHFDFLFADYGFHVVSATPETVEAASDVCRVHFSLDRVNLFVDLEDPRQPGRLDLASLARFKDPASNFAYKWCSTPQKIEREARRLAEALRRHGVDLLRGDFSQRAAIAAAGAARP